MFGIGKVKARDVQIDILRDALGACEAELLDVRNANIDHQYQVETLQRLACQTATAGLKDAAEMQAASEPQCLQEAQEIVEESGF